MLLHCDKISLEEGQAFLRQIRIQVVAYVNADTPVVDLYLPKPVAEDVYYASFSAVERPNLIMCDDLKLDKKLCDHSWYRRVNLSIFGVYVVDT